MKSLFTILITALAALIIPVTGHAAPKAKRIAKGLDRPVFLTAPLHSTDYLYILEKEGRIKLYNRKTKRIEPKPFLDISDRIKIKMNEQGLLGLAFSPHFSQDKRLYVYYTDLNGDTQVSRFTAKSSTAAKQNEEILLIQTQDFRNHNGAWIGFGPDNMLYIALGDGGAANDPKQRAQDLTSLLGKLLRIDVRPAKGYTIPKDNPFINTKNARPEILSYGLRNPWRCSWHKDTLWVADVGQNLWEEINAVAHPNLFSANFGWPQFEGMHRTNNPPAKTQNPGTIIQPVYEYPHDNSPRGGMSVTGGYVYKGSVKSLKNRYIFADFIQPHIWSATMTQNTLSNLKQHKKQFAQKRSPIQQISSFGEDPQGELYILSHKGEIFQIID